MGEKTEYAMTQIMIGRTKMWRMGVLFCMVVTAAVFQLERSELNTNADWNAVKVHASKYNSVVDPIRTKSGRRTKKKEMGEKTEVDQRHTRNGRIKELE